MKITAELNYLRIAPRKVRLIADLIRGKSVPEAEHILQFLSRRAAGPVQKLLRSATANAKQNFQIASPGELVIAEIAVNSGPTLKRSRPRAFGRASAIHKRTSHVTLILESRGEEIMRGKTKKPAMAVVRGEGKASAPSKESSTLLGGGQAGPSRTPEREAFRAKARVSAKPADFVRRMFRRKAI